MASASLGSLLDKENEVSATVRTPHAKGTLRIPSTSSRLPSVSEEPVLKPGQRHLSVNTPGLNNRFVFNTVNTPLKTPSNMTTNFFFGSCEPAVKPKIVASPAVEAVDYLVRESLPSNKDDEDYDGEFVEPENRVSNYLKAISTCNVLYIFGHCFAPSGSTSEDDESLRLVDGTKEEQPRRRRVTEAVEPTLEMTRVEAEDVFAAEPLVEESDPVPQQDRQSIVTERERKMQ